MGFRAKYLFGIRGLKDKKSPAPMSIQGHRGEYSRFHSALHAKGRRLCGEGCMQSLFGTCDTDAPITVGIRPTLPASDGIRFASASHGRISTCLLCRFHLVDTLCKQILRRRSPDRGLFVTTIIILWGAGVVNSMGKIFSPFSDFVPQGL